MPEIRWITPIYHPNISEIGMVCLGGYGTHWVPSVQLDELCVMLWDMARYHNYDIRSPYNRDAALWVASQTKFLFPTDPRPLRDLRAALGRVESDGGSGIRGRKHAGGRAIGTNGSSKSPASRSGAASEPARRPSSPVHESLRRRCSRKTPVAERRRTRPSRADAATRSPSCAAGSVLGRATAPSRRRRDPAVDQPQTATRSFSSSRPVQRPIIRDDPRRLPTGSRSSSDDEIMFID